jgi:hypothetical protein
MLAALPLISVWQVMDAPSRTVTVTRTPRFLQAFRTFEKVGSSRYSWKSLDIIGGRLAPCNRRSTHHGLTELIPT